VSKIQALIIARQALVNAWASSQNAVGHSTHMQAWEVLTKMLLKREAKLSARVVSRQASSGGGR
jgi:hypothetical protein